MSKVFVDQTYLRISLDTNVDLTGYLELRIYYRKPDGTVDYLPAACDTPANGIIYYDLDSDSTLLDARGAWKFWSWAKFDDGRTARGETVGITIWSEDE
jgi:hypothetical protein